MMDNAAIASVLETVADLLEIRGDSPFRVRAYRKAADTLRELEVPVARMVELGKDLTLLPGVGKEMAAHILELLREGDLLLLRRLSREVPLSLLELLRLEGVGPGRARKLWQTLGVTSVADLEEALRNGKLEGLEGFGAKTLEKLAQAVARFRAREGWYLLADADRTAARLVPSLEGVPGVKRVAVVGSVRRRVEAVRDLDLLVETDEDRDWAAVRRWGWSLGEEGQGEEEVVGGGELRLRLPGEVPVHLHRTGGEGWGAALHRLTGSTAHLEALASLLGGGTGKPVLGPGGGLAEGGVGGEELGARGEAESAWPEEEEVFRRLGLPWIPPELREGWGEVEAAVEGRLPELLLLRHIRGDLQMHSVWSDGTASLADMARACRARGYEYMAITDHSQAVTVAGGLSPDRVRRQWEELETARKDVRGIRILRSLEVDILKDGSLDMPDEILEELDLVVISVHSHLTMEREEMTRRILRALEHPAVDILAHPTGRLLLRRDPIEADWEAILEAAAKHKVAVELNANPHRLDFPPPWLRRAKELGVKVAISTDAHSVAELDHMAYGIDQARRGWLEPPDVLNTMPWEAFESWLLRRAGARSVL